VRPVGIITRIGRLRARLDTEVAAVFDRYDLTPADFEVIVTLRRCGSPFRLPQARLMTRLGLTSGTVSVRIDRLVTKGVVRRERDQRDARVTFVGLTEQGHRLFDDVAPVHLRNEDRLLSALDDNERDQLAGLLRRLLASLERDTVDTARSLGLELEPAPLARARRAAVGLSDKAGLLVLQVLPGTAAARAGVTAGDLIVAVDDRPTRNGAALHAAIEAARATATLRLLRGDQEVALTIVIAGR
jgi:DNA-binding MarR family transcriptional regulator